MAKWYQELLDDFDEPFVVDFNIFFYDDDPTEHQGDFGIGANGDKNVLRFFISIRRLLSFSSNTG